MKPEIAEKWIEALNSGNYSQGVRALKEGNNFCCLGVLCDLAAKEGIGRWRNDNNRFGIDFFNVNGEDGEDQDCMVLPPGVLSWAGMNTKHFYGKNGLISVDANNANDVITLSSLNDRGKTFNEIADVIEKNVDIL